MMEKYYRKLSDFLVSNHSIKKSDSELYEYAAKVFFQSIISIVVTIFIGIAFGMIKECLCFIFVFIILRKFTGGLHAKKYSHCLISSTALIIMSLIVIRVLEKNHFQIIFMCLTMIAVVIICVLSPIESNNKPLSKNEKKVYKIISVVLSLVLLILVVLLWLKNSVFSYSIGNGLIVVSTLIVFGIVEINFNNFIERFMGYYK